MTSTVSTTQQTIKVSIVSDITCPWCYVCIKEIDRAVQNLQLPAGTSVRFEFEHIPYLLHPGWREDEWKNASDYLKEKIGQERWEKVNEVLLERGKEVGIKFRVDDGIVCSTLRAHRLLLLAWNRGGSDAQMKLLNTIFRGKFEQVQNVGDIDVLASYAEECGLISKDEAREFLKTDELTADVRHMMSCAQRNGVTGVPFTLFNSRWAISGGQGSDVYREIFEKLARGEEP